MNRHSGAIHTQSASETRSVGHVVITVHGIRTFGQWQERLERLLKAENEDFEVRHYKFGRFSLIAFLIPFLRWIVTRRFRKELLEIAKQYPNSRIDLVGHSFGTHLIGWGLYHIPKSKQPKIHTIILAGSVLRPSFPWGELLSRGTVHRVINECGTRDIVLVLNQLFVVFTGVAGILGFKGMTSDRLRNNWYGFGHSGYFRERGKDTDDFMRERWIPLLTSKELLPQIDERPQGELYSVWVFLLQNLEFIKVGVYVTCVLLLMAWYKGTKEARETAFARELATQSEIIREQQPNLLPQSVLLAIQSLRQISTFEGDLALRRSLTLVPRFVKEIGTLPDTVSVTTLSFSSDDSLLAIVGSNNSVQVWKINPVTSVSHLTHKSEVEALTFVPNSHDLLTVTKEGTLWLWSEGGEHEYRRIAKDADTAVVYQGLNRQIVAYANADFTVTLWVTTTGRKFTLPHDNRVMSLAFNADGHWLATGSYDYSARVWSVFGGKPSMEKRIKNNHPVSAVALSPDGRLLAFGDTFGLIRIWDLSADREVSTSIRHLDWVTSLAFSPDGKWLASGSRDMTARVWDPDTGHEVTRITGNNPFSSVAFSHDGQWLAVGGGQGAARIWDISKTLPVKTDGQVCALAFSPDGQNLVSGDTFGNVEVDALYSPARATKLRETNRQEAAVLAITYAPKDRSLIAGFDDGILRSWDAEKPHKAKTIIRTGVSADSLAFSADGRHVAFGNWDGTIVIFDTSNGKQLASMHHPGGALAVALGAEGRYLGTGGSDKTVRIWEWASSTTPRQITHDDAVSAVAFSRDGRYLATGAGRIARVWDIRTLRKLAELRNDATVELVSFSQDGHFIITTGTDRSARVWNWSSAQRVSEIEFDDTICAVAFDTDNILISLGSKDGKARVWPLNPESMIGEACRRLENYPPGSADQNPSRWLNLQDCVPPPFSPWSILTSGIWRNRHQSISARPEATR